MINHPTTDCAEDLFDRSKRGKIVEITSNETYITIEGEEFVDGYYYHQVYIRDKYVFDPQHFKDPVPEKWYFDKIRRNNPEGYNVGLIDEK